ncbi:protein LSD1-like [Phalaenopsis equestris]|uniref:protein LSD1-like n=1 Tax=Phalaenopsis equestris TaxID=78828 RepID=UPI0009E5303A|nr:protein LSD1-like [Phalaenopsis equestris]XP_020586442.1 protein LSD1-like [Phalaenopsis equestris]
MPGELVCSGCRSLLRYEGVTNNVRCAICNTITPVFSQPQDAAQLVCGGCHRLLMYARGATSVRCSCCNTINQARSANQLAHVNCAQCHTMLVYPHGAPCVKCALCNFITRVAVNSGMMPIQVNRPSGAAPSLASTSAPSPNSNNQTVVIENPMSIDQSGKLVTNFVVGVAAGKK